MKSFCSHNGFPDPSFVVIQTGTRVMEMKNVGSFDCPVRVADELPAEIQVPRMIDICNRSGIMMKEHNTDYLSDEALQWHPRLGIHAANIAPELGVTESKAFVSVLEHNSMSQLADDFLQLSVNSMKWKKWMLPASKASDRDKGFISGHYIFSTPEFLELKAKAVAKLASKSIVLDDYLQNSIRKNITRYLSNFRVI
jgi:hypothetical protein